MIDIQVEFSFDVNQILMNGRVVIFRGIGLDIAHANEQLYSPNRNRCGPQDYVQVEKAASLCALEHENCGGIGLLSRAAR